MRTELERAAGRLEAERLAFDKRQASEAGGFEAWRAAEVARLERDRRVLDKQTKALLKVRGLLGLGGLTWALLRQALRCTGCHTCCAEVSSRLARIGSTPHG